MCRMWWPLTLTYIFKVIWPWLWKSCLLCNVFSSRSIIFLTWDPIVWVIMRRRGVSSERRRSSCSSYWLLRKLNQFLHCFIRNVDLNTLFSCCQIIWKGMTWTLSALLSNKNKEYDLKSFIRHLGWEPRKENVQTDKVSKILNYHAYIEA